MAGPPETFNPQTQGSLWYATGKAVAEKGCRRLEAQQHQGYLTPRAGFMVKYLWLEGTIDKLEILEAFLTTIISQHGRLAFKMGLFGLHTC